MKLCEDCIKKDVCKFRKKVEKFEAENTLPEPLENGITCKYRRTEPSNWYTVTCPTVSTGTYSPYGDTTTTACDIGDDIHAYTAN